jgi:hypothetical protein
LKSPTQLVSRLRKKWQDVGYREERLLDANAWPLSLAIGKPTATEFANQAARVREHVTLWRAVGIGHVQFETVSYRAGGEPVQIPTVWVLRDSAEWAAATVDPAIASEHAKLAAVLPRVDPAFHRTVIRQLRRLPGINVDDVLRAVELALALEPGCADGRPLRALSLAGIDSKFFERHRGLVQQLLDTRYDGQVSELGLESFLGALDEGDHWLLVAPLDRTLLPFAKQSVPAAELAATGLPGTHVLVIENESSLYQLPSLPDTVAVLGSGLDLAWMRAPWLKSRAIGYWGDLDTWGLVMLATARAHQPELDALLMDAETFEASGALAVPEPYPASDEPLDTLNEPERALFLRLRNAERGRLEQEFLPRETVIARLSTWRFKAAD